MPRSKTAAWSSLSGQPGGRLLLVEGRDTSQGDLLLQPADYPDYYVDMAHPEDYKVQDKPIPLEHIVHRRTGHWRMIFRVSFRCDDEKSFVPMSFVCDTGAPYDFYLSDRAMMELEKGGRLREDDLGNAFLSDVVGNNSAVKEIPYTHEPGNLIGMRLMLRLGFVMGDGSFGFSKPLKHF